jgi:hypothetical protein
MKQPGANEQLKPGKRENQIAGDFETPTTQTDNLARIATALERIADCHQQLLGCSEDQLEVLKEINQEIYSFSRYGFGF